MGGDIANAARAGQSKALRDDDLARIDRIAPTMDSRYKVPPRPWRVGLDTLVGLIPGAGDATTTLSAGSIIAQGLQRGARDRTSVRMALDAGLDAVFCAVRFRGAAFDLLYKANPISIALLREEPANHTSKRALST